MHRTDPAAHAKHYTKLRILAGVEQMNIYDEIHFTIELSKFKCKSEKELVNELIAEPILLFNENPMIFDILSSRDLCKESIKKLTKHIKNIIVNGEQIPSKNKYKVDSLLKKLSPILPSEIEFKFACEFIKHNRKNRREKGFSIFKYHNFSNQELVDLLNLYKSLKNQELLRYIARNIYVTELPFEDYKYIIDEIDDDYWKCRIIEFLIENDIDNQLKTIINKYPLASIRAMGRKKKKVVLKYVKQTFTNFLDDADSLGLIFWALGQIGDYQEIQKLEDELKKHLGL